MEKRVKGENKENESEKKKVNYLARLKTPLPKKYSLAAFDTEDDGRGNFTFGYVYGERKDKKVEQSFTDKIKMARFMNDLDGCVIIGLNTDYDLCNLEPFIEVKKLYSKARFVMGRNKLRTKYYDLSNHFFTSLENLMPLIGMKKVELEKVEERCKTDAVATYLLGVQLQDFYLKSGSKLNSTLGTCALEIYKRRFLKHFWVREDYFNDIEREAYRGGRCELFFKGELKLNSYDVRSMYLSVMRDNLLPDPNKTYLYLHEAYFKKIFKDDYQGVVDCTVFIPNMMYPPLPYLRKKDSKLIFPCGTFRGCWTFEELKMAERVGGEIKKVHKWIYYKASYYYFKEFADWVWSERKKTSNKFSNLMIKRLGNSLYGKFGQQNEKCCFYGKLDDFDGEALEGMTPHLIQIGNTEYLSLTGGPKINSSHTFTIISAYISSFARIKLYEEMIKHRTVYCDTDSLKILDTMPTSNRLGGWKFEGRGLFTGFKPKAYKFKKKIRIKGVPKRAKMNWFEKGVMVAEFTRPFRFREALRRGLVFNLWKKQQKKIGMIDNKRKWDKKGNSQPLTLSL